MRRLFANMMETITPDFTNPKTIDTKIKEPARRVPRLFERCAAALMAMTSPNSLLKFSNRMTVSNKISQLDIAAN